MKILKGNLVSVPALGKLEIVEHGCLVLHDDGSIQSVEKAVPQNADAEVIDYGDSLIMPSFVDMHLHAPQYPMLGMGMDLPLIDWLNTYTFKTEARFEDSDYARRIYKKLASDLITSGTTRVCMFSSLHTDATLILMEELEKAGVTGYVGKVNMDRNGSPELQETTEQSKRETLRWLDACGRFKTVKPILTPRFTPSCTDELMSWLGKLAAERGLYVQSHLKIRVRSRGSKSSAPTARNIGRATTARGCGRITPSWRTASTPTSASARPCANTASSRRTARGRTSTSARASRPCGRCCARATSSRSGPTLRAARCWR